MEAVLASIKQNRFVPVILLLMLIGFFTETFAANLSTAGYERTASFEQLSVNCIYSHLKSNDSQTKTISIHGSSDGFTQLEQDLIQTIHENSTWQALLSNNLNLPQYSMEIGSNIYWFIKEPAEISTNLINFLNNSKDKTIWIFLTSDLNSTEIISRIFVGTTIEYIVSKSSCVAYENEKINCEDDKFTLLEVKKCDNLELNENNDTYSLRVSVIHKIPFIYDEAQKKRYRGIEHSMLDALGQKLNIELNYYAANNSGIGVFENR